MGPDAPASRHALAWARSSSTGRRPRRATRPGSPSRTAARTGRRSRGSRDLPPHDRDAQRGAEHLGGRSPRAHGRAAAANEACRRCLGARVAPGARAAIRPRPATSSLPPRLTEPLLYPLSCRARGRLSAIGQVSLLADLLSAAGQDARLVFHGLVVDVRSCDLLLFRRGELPPFAFVEDLAHPEARAP
jgi:hypothetical protein